MVLSYYTVHQLFVGSVAPAFMCWRWHPDTTGHPYLCFPLWKLWNTMVHRDKLPLLRPLLFQFDIYCAKCLRTHNKIYCCLKWVSSPDISSSRPEPLPWLLSSSRVIACSVRTLLNLFLSYCFSDWCVCIDPPVYHLFPLCTAQITSASFQSLRLLFSGPLSLLLTSPTWLQLNFSLQSTKVSLKPFVCVCFWLQTETKRSYSNILAGQREKLNLCSCIVLSNLY